MPRRHATAVFTSALIAVAACQDEPRRPAPPPATATAAAPRPPRAGLTGAATEVAITGFTIDATVPTGWTPGPFGEGVMYRRDAAAYTTSTLFITPSCQGNCATVAANVDGFLAAQRTTHAELGYQVEVLDDRPLAGGGRQFRLRATRDRDALVQVVAIHHRPGWPVAVTCSGTLLGDDRDAADLVAGWCRDLAATPR